MTTTQLPVLFLTDLVVLPGMVVPIELDDAAQAAIDAARAQQRRASCWWPRASTTATPRTAWSPPSCSSAACRPASRPRCSGPSGGSRSAPA